MKRNRKFRKFKKLNLVKFFIWLFSEKPKQMPIKNQKRIKGAIKTFFEDSYYGDEKYSEAQISIPIQKFGISNFKFQRFKANDVITITLEHPGIMIGKGGRTIDALTKYLSEINEKPVKLWLLESKVWY